LLRKYNDPKIVFAVSCAAVSCPDRTNEIFEANNFEEQITRMLQKFFTNESKGLKLERETKKLTLSWILKKDGHLFKQGDGKDILDFVIKYAPINIANYIEQNRKDLTIEYFDHDWALNDIALADN